MKTLSILLSFTFSLLVFAGTSFKSDLVSSCSKLMKDNANHKAICECVADNHITSMKSYSSKEQEKIKKWLLVQYSDSSNKDDQDDNRQLSEFDYFVANKCLGKK